HAFSEESPPRASSGPSPVDRFIEFTSSDSGVHWKARVVPNGAGTSFVDPPVAAVDPGTGKLYVAWNQDGPKGTAVKSTIYLSSSADGGATWTRPVDLVDPAAHARSDAYSPGISVAPDGRVDVAWDDFRSDPQRTGSIFSGAPTLDSTSTTERLFDVYASSSLDSARTWSADYRVSDRSIDDVYGVTFSDRLFAPIGMASTNDALYVSWADSRNSREPTAVDDAYFTRVEAHPAALSGAAVGRSAGSAASWALIGAGGLLALLGLGLLVGSRRRSFGSPGRGAHPSS
ncbi:MAG: sialidase family protein, partial [Acidimicrobiales bacterium]